MIPEPPRRPYHHGNLREALLQAAVEEIAASGPARLSLREVARRVGVSSGAPAHHFGDKQGLLAAVAADGYRGLAEATARAAQSPTENTSVALAYVRYAVSHPAHFAVMFRPDLYDPAEPELKAQRDAAGAVLIETIARQMPTGTEQQHLSAAIAAWSFTHGFATLWLTGNLDLAGAAGQDPVSVAGDALDALLRLAEALAAHAALDGSATERPRRSVQHGT